MSKKKSKIEVQRETVPEVAESWPSLMSLRQEVDRLFDDFGSGLWREPLSRRMHALFPQGSDWTLRPATEFVECDGEFRMTAELPGMTVDDIEIKLSDGTVTIRGEKTEEKKEEKEDYLVSERRYGQFQRTLALPTGIDADKVSAEFTNGVLTVTLPKSAEAKQKERKVEIRSAA